MDMKAKKKGITHKQLAASRSQFVLLVLMLAFTILLLIGYLLKDYNPALQQEAEGFTKLKQDILDLQKEFNKVDAGWTYHEGCVGAGGVFDRNKATSCSLGIQSVKSMDMKKFDEYKKLTISDKGQRRFKTDSEQPADANRFFLSSDPFPKSQCSISLISADEPSGSKYISIGCSADAHQFYFERTDR